MTCMLTLLLLCAAPVASAAAAPATAVLPIKVKGPATGEHVGRMLTHALTEHYARLVEGVIGAAELEELLRHEANRQLLGCDDDGCLARIAAALEAEQLVVGTVLRAGPIYLWTSSLVRQQDGQVVRRTSVKGGSLEALLASAEQVAFRLAGLDGQEGARATQATLGLEKPEDLAALQAFERARPGTSRTDALTAFIISHNQESRVLAVAQALAFSLAGLLVAPTMGLILAAVLTNSASQWWVLGASSAAAMSAGLALVAATVGVSLVAVDALNLGRVRVKEEGCCRDDAEILEQEADVRGLQAPALMVLLSGPMSVALGGAACIGLMTVVPLLGPLNTAEAPAPVWLGFPATLAFFGSIPLACGSMAVVSVASALAGLLLMWNPQPDLVEREEAGEP